MRAFVDAEKLSRKTDMTPERVSLGIVHEARLAHSPVAVGAYPNTHGGRYAHGTL